VLAYYDRDMRTATRVGRLPDFVVAGVPKGGTTSLFYYLQPHPQVWMPANKELHFFSNNFARGEDWFRAQFAGARPEHVTGEMSAEYLQHPRAVERMAELIPDVKVVAILRHPVERAYSHYQMQRAKFSATESFRDIVERELAGGVEAVPQPHAPYLRGGRYHEHIQRFLQHYPRSSLLVLLMDDLKREPVRVYRELCAHIAVDSDPLPENLGRRYNRTMPVRSRTMRKVMVRLNLEKRLPGSLGQYLDYFNRDKGEYEPLDDDMRGQLLDYYRDDTTALAQWLGRDLSGWMR
jgi:hypothetical protein